MAQASIMAQVEGRAALGVMGYTTASIFGSPLGAKGTARKQSPPIPDGVTHCVEKIYKAVANDYPLRKADFEPMPRLLRRIRYLIRVFYDFKISKKRTPDLIYCDFDEIFEVSLKLHKIALYLQLDPPRLRAFMAAGGKDIESYILDDPLDLGPYRREAARIEKLVEEDEEANDDDRMGADDISERATDDLAAHIMCWFFADLHVAFIINGQRNEHEKRWYEKALKRVVKWSTSATWRDALGDPLTDSMRPIYWTKPVLIKFSQAGGLGALFGDWVQSTCEQLCEKTLSGLPDETWENQTKESLRAITREMQRKIDYEPDSILGPIFVNAFYNIYKRYDLAPFQLAAKYETFRTSILFYFISHRIKKDGLQMKTKEDWRRLMQEYKDLPRTSERRYSWGRLTISGKWDCITLYGCNNEHCPEKQVLLQARAKRVRGERNSEIEERLHNWGSKAKGCSGCQKVSYCSSECQKADWPGHKQDCMKARKKKTQLVKAK